MLEWQKLSHQEQEDYLAKIISWGIRRVVLQYRFQLCMLDAEGED